VIVTLLLALSAQAGTSSTSTSTADQIDYLKAQIADLELRLTAVEGSSIDDSPFRFTGYVDVGFFWARGNGSGVVEDFGHRLAPELGQQWVFLGDLLSTAVNSRGEAADLGLLPGVQRFDGIHSRGAPGFILNAVNFSLAVRLRDRLFITTSLDVVPRTGADFDLGDFLDLDLAQLEWTVDDTGNFVVFLGKITPVIGIEYRERKSTERFGITPSLIARYTTGTVLGLKARAKLFDEALVLAASVTNGGAGTEQFHFYDETDSNAGKTAAARIAGRLPLDRWLAEASTQLEIGFSGEVGSQNRARDSEGIAWAFGVDVLYMGVDLRVKAQFLKAESPGRPEDDVYSLKLNAGALLEVDYNVTGHVGVMVRGEIRDALVGLDSRRIYRTQGWRLTIGARFTIIPDVVLKLEYLKNGEYGVVPEIDNDVMTSSLVLSY